MSTNWNTEHWSPASTSKIWIYTVEAADCKNTPFSCMGPNREQIIKQNNVVHSRYVTFRTPTELSSALNGFLDSQNDWVTHATNIDSIVLQISVHGKDFQTLFFDKMAHDLSSFCDILNNNLSPNTVILFNQCWGGWPRWARVFRKKDGSPRFIFGSIKRYGTAVEALNSAEVVVLDWLRGVAHVGANVTQVVQRINDGIATNYEGHEHFYRGWYWLNGDKRCIPPFGQGGLGLPVVRYLTCNFDDYVLHIYADNKDTDQLVVKANHHGLPIGGPWAVQQHGPHTPGMQRHLHVYYRDNKLFAINQDGTAHDASHGVPIPRRVVEGIQKYFPDFVIPPNNFIKSIYSIPA